MSRYNKVLYIIFFSCVFMVLGSLVPNIILKLLPSDVFVRVDYYNASDVNISETCYQVLEWKRDVSVSSRVDIIRSLSLVETSNDRIVYVVEDRDYLEKGNDVKRKEVRLPDNLKPGSYYWEAGITFYPDKDVAKNIEVTSNIFQVYR